MDAFQLLSSRVASGTHLKQCFDDGHADSNSHLNLFDDHTLDERIVASVTGYFGMWMIAAIGGTLCLCAFNIDLVTASTSVLATLNNIGPGLHLVGPTQNFAALPDLVKLLLSLFMIIGRLEFYALVVLLVPGFWRQ